MKLFAINGSPRKKWNTAIMLDSVMKGARSTGAETEIIQLYDLAFTGCRSCFACKQKGRKQYGHCSWKDELTPVLKKIEDEADIIIMGTPIYFGAMTGEMRSFLERLLFPPIVYSVPPKSLFPRKIRTAMIYTMNTDEKGSTLRNYDFIYRTNEAYLKNIFGSTESFYCFDTYQFPDYSKIEMELYSPELKAKRREEEFPKDIEKAFELGKRLAAC